VLGGRGDGIGRRAAVEDLRPVDEAGGREILFLVIRDQLHQLADRQPFGSLDLDRPRAVHEAEVENLHPLGIRLYLNNGCRVSSVSAQYCSFSAWKSSRAE
jgi:hypothetical protein